MANRRSGSTQNPAPRVSRTLSLLLCRVLKAKSKSRSRAASKTARSSLPAVFPGLTEEFAKKFFDGKEHFNSRRFFESHESWEEIWLKSEGAEKRRLQGLIQIAAAFHHHSRANLAGTESLLRAGLAKISDAPAHHWGLNLAMLRCEVNKWLRALESKKPVGRRIPPRLKPPVR